MTPQPTIPARVSELLNIVIILEMRNRETVALRFNVTKTLEAPLESGACGATAATRSESAWGGAEGGGKDEAGVFIHQSTRYGGPSIVARAFYGGTSRPSSSLDL